MPDSDTTITSALTPDLAKLREWLARTLAAGHFVELIAAVVALFTKMAALNAELTRRLALGRRKHPRSETLDRLERQLTLPLDGELFAPTTQPDATAAPASPDATADTPEPPEPRPPPRRPHPGRTPPPDHLPRVPEPNPVPEAMRVCPKCGAQMPTVSHSRCLILDVTPAQVIVRERIDETVACPNDDMIVSSPVPPAIVERGMLGDTLIVEAVADKYIEHMPIERQCTRFARAGVQIAPQTLGRSVNAAIDLLVPIAAAISTETRGPGNLGTDATGLPILDANSREGIRNGTIWCWTNASWVSFVYSPSGDADSVRRFLGPKPTDVARSVQCDGTSVTNFIERAGGKRPGCWSHGRRRFVEAAKSGDQLAHAALKIIARLFAVEKASTLADDSDEQRSARRMAQSKPVLDELRTFIDEHRGTTPPKTPLGQALGYLDRQWQRLLLFLDDGNIELTNNRRSAARGISVTMPRSRICRVDAGPRTELIGTADRAEARRHIQRLWRNASKGSGGRNRIGSAPLGSEWLSARSLSRMSAWR
jgi:transposase